MPLGASYPFPLINGYRATMADVSLTLLSNGIPLPIIGTKSVDWSWTYEKGRVWGTDVAAVGQTRGKFMAKGSIDIYQAEAQAFRLALAVGGRGYADIVFQINIRFDSAETILPVGLAPLGPFTLIDVYLQGCTITEESNVANAGSEEALAVKFNFNLYQPIVNGVPATFSILQALAATAYAVPSP